MEEAVANLMNEDILKKAGRLFSCENKPYKLLGDFENYVYEVECHGQPFILRLTHSSHRTTEMVEAELHWLSHLAEHQVSVARPVRSHKNRLVEVIPVLDTYFNVSLFEKAPGIMVKKDDVYWGPQLFREWGRTIGHMHRTTMTYHESPGLSRRLSWDEDDLLEIASYLPSDQTLVIDKTKQHIEMLKSLSKDSRSYGLIHGDIHPGNFFVHNGKLTVFDFDDAMYHWFASDIAIALYYSLFMIKESERETFTHRFMSSFMEGYREEHDLESEWMERIPEFLKLRDIALYAVFYKKLDMDHINEDRKNLLAALKYRIENSLPAVQVDFSLF